MTPEEIRAAIEGYTQASAATIAALTAELDGVKNNLLELEQKSADRLDFIPGHGAPTVVSTLSENALFKDVLDKKSTRTSVEVKTFDLLGIETKNTITNNAGDFATATDRGIFGGLQRRRFLLDYLNIVPVSGGSVQFSKETTFTNNAAVQASGSPSTPTEGAAKAESVIDFDLKSLTVPTVAHFVKASRQVLSDVATLRAYVDNRLRYGLSVKLDAEIINGIGTAPAGGLTKSGNYTAFTPSTGETGLDSLNRALGVLETNEASGNLLLLNPTNYRALQRLKASTSGEYLFGAPSGSNSERVWNCNVLPTNAVTAGKFLALDTTQLGEFYLRQDATVDVGYVNDDFTKNLVTLLAEVRGMLAVVRSEAVIYGNLTQA